MIFFYMLMSALTFVVALLVSLGIYIFACYVLYRLGAKFGIGTFPKFLIPVYNIMLLCDCAAATRWLTAAIVAPFFVMLAVSALGALFAPVTIASGTQIISLCANVYLWGRIAERLGKNFWLWGIATPLLLGLPILVLAFGDSAVQADYVRAEFKSGKEDGKERGERRYIDI